MNVWLRRQSGFDGRAKAPWPRREAASRLSAITSPVSVISCSNHSTSAWGAPSVHISNDGYNILAAAPPHSISFGGLRTPAPSRRHLRSTAGIRLNAYSLPGLLAGFFVAANSSGYPIIRASRPPRKRKSPSIGSPDWLPLSFTCSGYGISSAKSPSTPVWTS